MEKRAIQVSHELWKEIMTQGYTSAGARCIEGIPEDAVLVGYFYTSHFAPADEVEKEGLYKNYPDACLVFESDNWTRPAREYTVTDPHTHEDVPVMHAVFQAVECRTCTWWKDNDDQALPDDGYCFELSASRKASFGCTGYEPRETND